MPSPFPGMDPYLEQPELWPDVHNGLIVELRNALAPQLRPRYYVALEERTYRAEPAGLTFVSRHDVTIVGSPTPAASGSSPGEASLTGVATLEPVTVELPIPESVRETYLEVRLAQTHADQSGRAPTTRCALAFQRAPSHPELSSSIATW